MTTGKDASSPSLSFEIFPPNTQVGAKKLLTTLDQLQELNPDFISVTCSNNKAKIEETTIKVADYVNRTLQIPTLPICPPLT